jgi:hypothetical protein
LNVPERYRPQEVLSGVEALLYFCKEREIIRLKREAGEPGPWTTDETLLKYRFCNVRRRDDRVSAWLIENVLTQQNIDYDLKSFLMFSAWCRFVNWPVTIQAVLNEGFYPKKRINWVGIGKFVDNLSKKQKAWTGAYMVRAPNKSGAKKGKFVAETVVGTNFKASLPQLTKLLRTPGVSYRETWQLLQTINGYGSFYAGQIAGDWTYTSLLSSAPDLTTFAPMGPGSVRGFNRLLGIETINKRPPEERWLDQLAEWRELIISELGPGYEGLTALDTQNCLCEIFKYLRGYSRANYRSHQDEY